MVEQYGGIDREACWVAFFELIRSALQDKAVTIGRHHVPPPNLMPEQQPAVFVVQAREKREPRPHGLPVKVTLCGFLVIYFQAPRPMLDATGDEGSLGATTINDLLKAIDDAMVPDDPVTGKLTLGDLVEHCYIEGSVDIDAGILTEQGAALLPVCMTVP